MNRSEKRAQARRKKGGCTVHTIHVSFGKINDQFRDPILDYGAKYCDELHKKEVLRSKQVPGY